MNYDILAQAPLVGKLIGENEEERMERKKRKKWEQKSPNPQAEIQTRNLQLTWLMLYDLSDRERRITGDIRQNREGKDGVTFKVL